MNDLDPDMGAMDLVAPADDEHFISDVSSEDSDQVDQEMRDLEDCNVVEESNFKPRLIRTIQHLRSSKRKLKQLRTENVTLQRRCRRLDARIAALQNREAHGKTLRTQRTWPNEIGTIGYSELMKLASLEGNQSPRYVHPDLQLRAPRKQDMVRSGGAGEAITMQLRAAGSTKRLGLIIEARVLQYALRFDQGIHALARLDPFVAATAADLPRDGSGAVTYLRRFHVGSRSCNLTYSASRPAELLAPLLVCRAWHTIGSHLFYTNKFFFSSLGELGLFMGGIGSKIALLSRIELLWIGSQFLTYKTNDRRKFVSRRTQPLMCLPQCLRLRELTIYVRETAQQHIRRGHETRGVVRYAKNMTEFQPDYRGTRNLHTLQGLDYVKCLRGLTQAQFFDYDQWLTRNEKQVPVRNVLFSDSIRAAVLQEKRLEHYVRSRLRNLPQLIAGHNPPDEVWACIEAIGVDKLPDRVEPDKDVEDSESESDDRSSMDLDSSSDDSCMDDDSSSDDSTSDDSSPDDDSTSGDSSSTVISNNSSRVDLSSINKSHWAITKRQPDREDEQNCDIKDGHSRNIVDLTDNAAGRPRVVIDLTDASDSQSLRESIHSGGRGSERRSDSESPLFVKDDDYLPCYKVEASISPPRMSEDRKPLFGSPEGSEESSLFVRSDQGVDQEQEIIDLTGGDD